MMKNPLLLIFALLFGSSCERVLFKEDMESSDPYLNFDYLWKECDEHYSFFDLKDIDWDQVYDRYEAMLYPEMSDDSLFQVLGQMLNELRDGHVNLISNFNVSFYDVNGLGQDNYNWRTVTDHYIGTDYYISGPFVNDFLADGAIGYIRYSSFTGTADYTNLDFVLSRFRNTEGIIFDIRENGGGVASDIFWILSHFVDRPTLLYYSRIKNGPAHDDFSERDEAVLDPYQGIRYLQDVIVLTDRGTYSAGSFMALACKALDRMTLMGDTTGGGLGMPNGGQLPNGWTYRFSITQSLTLDGNPEYENGVPPDVPAFFDWENINRDEVLDLAIETLLN